VESTLGILIHTTTCLCTLKVQSLVPEIYSDQGSFGHAVHIRDISVVGISVKMSNIDPLTIAGVAALPSSDFPCGP